MSLIPWKNKNRDQDAKALARRDPSLQFHREMDHLIERFFSDPWGAFPATLGSIEGWNPTVDVTENEKEILVRAEVPGVDPKQINVSLLDNVLTIEGEKKEHSEQREGHFYRSECSFGSFRRSIPLPASVEEEKIAAEHANGVVTIRLQKSQSAAPKRIPVRTA